jgi:phosphate transport system permease protein
VEAARPLVYATALLLVMITLLLNLVAIGIRNRLRERYRTLEA